jgi:hypothetical protein
MKKGFKGEEEKKFLAFQNGTAAECQIGNVKA